MRRTQTADFFGEPVIVGAPAEVHERLAAFLERSPCTHLALYMNYPGTDPEHTRESMELFAAEVAPRLRAS
jgi:alkanesulfonate monooxygenase SsuD/methylene tetrahydromethanopterin reductase-like flavin-dependent oxidoreductase (luciferase family)